MEDSDVFAEEDVVTLDDTVLVVLELIVEDCVVVTLELSVEDHEYQDDTVTVTVGDADVFVLGLVVTLQVSHEVEDGLPDDDPL